MWTEGRGFLVCFWGNFNSLGTLLKQSVAWPTRDITTMWKVSGTQSRYSSFHLPLAENFVVSPESGIPPTPGFRTVIREDLRARRKIHHLRERGALLEDEWVYMEISSEVGQAMKWTAQTSTWYGPVTSKWFTFKIKNTFLWLWASRMAKKSNVHLTPVPLMELVLSRHFSYFLLFWWFCDFNNIHLFVRLWSSMFYAYYVSV